MCGSSCVLAGQEGPRTNPFPDPCLHGRGGRLQPGSAPRCPWRGSAGPIRDSSSLPSSVRWAAARASLPASGLALPPAPALPGGKRPQGCSWRPPWLCSWDDNRLWSGVTPSCSSTALWGGDATQIKAGESGSEPLPTPASPCLGQALQAASGKGWYPEGAGGHRPLPPSLQQGKQPQVPPAPHHDTAGLEGGDTGTIGDTRVPSISPAGPGRDAEHGALLTAPGLAAVAGGCRKCPTRPGVQFLMGAAGHLELGAGGYTWMVSGRARVIPPCHRGPLQLWWYLRRDGMGWAEAGAPQGDAPATSIPREHHCHW